MLRNRRASHDYELQETFEAGLELTGSEVKSLRLGGGSIAEAYARVENGQVFIENMTIPVYQQASYNNHEPTRRRRLLLNKREIVEISRALDRKGLTLIPTKLYFKDGWAKLQLALGRGKKMHDKRSDAAKRDAQREIDRALAKDRR